MTGPTDGRTAPVHLYDPPSEPGDLDPGVGVLLRTLTDVRHVEVLRHLADGQTDATSIARETSIPESAVEECIAGLSGAGLPAAESRRSGEAYSLVYGAIRLLSAALRHGVTGNGRTSGPRGNSSSDVPQPPLACTLCDNSGFVSRVLDELKTALSDVNEYHGRIREMSSQVLTAHEAERMRIARELHDDTAQAITSILVRLRLLELSSIDPEVLKNVEELRGLTAEALDSVRRMAMDLRPAALDDLGLTPALEAFAHRFSANWDIPVTVNVAGVRRRLPRDVELVLYRVLQEALTNVAKHSGAHEVRVTLSRRRNEVTMTVCDDGQGFGEQAGANTGLGLFGMRERLALVGGQLQVDTEQGAGTTVIASVPLSAHKRQKGDRR